MPKRLIDGFIGMCAMQPRAVSFVLLVLFFSGSYAVRTFASKAEVQSQIKVLTEQAQDNAQAIGAVRLKLERGYLEAAIRSLQSEVYGLERLVSKAEATGRDEQRLTDLLVELDQKQRDLQRLDAGVMK